MLEENKIYNMDCLEGLRQIRTGSVQAIITDPPYFQGLTQNGQRGDFADLTITKPFWKSLAREIARVLKPDGEFYIFMDWRGYAFYYPIFAEYLPVKNLIVWDKGTGPGSFYSYTHEFILYGTKNAGLRRGGQQRLAREWLRGRCCQYRRRKNPPGPETDRDHRAVPAGCNEGGRPGRGLLRRQLHHRGGSDQERAPVYLLRGQGKQLPAGRPQD